VNFLVTGPKRLWRRTDDHPGNVLGAIYGSEGWGFESLRARRKPLVSGSETRADRTLGPLLAIRWQSRRVEHREGSPCVGTYSSVGMTPGG
jgi:hypothetical protein